MKIPLNTPQEVGRLVRAVRKTEHLRQDDAAGAMGVSDVFLWKLEKGSPGVRLDKLLQVFRALGIKLYAEVSDGAAARYQVLAAPKPLLVGAKRRKRQPANNIPA